MWFGCNSVPLSIGWLSGHSGRTEHAQNLFLMEICHAVLSWCCTGEESFFFFFQWVILCCRNVSKKSEEKNQKSRNKMRCQPRWQTDLEEETLSQICVRTTTVADEDNDSSRWGQLMDCCAPWKMLRLSLKKQFWNTWRGCLLSRVGEDTALHLDPTPACPGWEAWDDQHHSSLTGMLSWRWPHSIFQCFLLSSASRSLLDQRQKPVVSAWKTSVSQQ